MIHVAQFGESGARVLAHLAALDKILYLIGLIGLEATK
jgi:hypothetical protein